MSKRNQKLLYLSYDGLGTHIGQSQILPYILRCREMGIDFHILTFEIQAHNLRVSGVQETLDQHGIRWRHLEYTTSRSVLLKIYDFIRFFAVALSMVASNRYSVIHGRSYMGAIVGLLIQPIYGAKLIFDKRDFWIDALLDVGRLQPSTLFHRPVHGALRWFEQRLFRHSDHIVSLTETAKQIVLRKYPTRIEDEISVIPCCVDLSLFDPGRVDFSQVQSRRAALGLNSSIVLGYAGSIDAAYRISGMLEFFKVIRNRIPDAQFLFVVNNGRDSILEIADQMGIPHSAIAVISSTREEMPLSISLFDVGVYFLTPTFAKQASSPTKLAEMLAMRRPVITNRGVGDVERIFRELQCGYLVSAFCTKEYEAAADWLQRNAKRQWHFSLDRYSLEYGSGKYFEVYQKLLGQAPS